MKIGDTVYYKQAGSIYQHLIRGEIVWLGKDDYSELALIITTLDGKTRHDKVDIKNIDISEEACAKWLKQSEIYEQEYIVKLAQQKTREDEKGANMICELDIDTYKALRKLGIAITIVEKTEEEYAEQRVTTFANHKLKTFNSGYRDNDKTLPYVFDLHFDIKTEGQLLESLDSTRISEMAKDYGYSKQYLSKELS